MKPRDNFLNQRQIIIQTLLNNGKDFLLKTILNLHCVSLVMCLIMKAQ